MMRGGRNDIMGWIRVIEWVGMNEEEIKWESGKGGS
jgi:hypothetical protein